MSVAEIKAEASRMSSAEALHLAAWFEAVAKRGDSRHLAELDATWVAMEGGHKVSLHDVRKLSADLDRSGA